MTQRIFDTDNEEDMKLLWSILPDDVNRITLDNLEKRTATAVFDCGIGHSISANLINIEWHDKTEITRPVYYEDMIGCVCKFSTCPIRIGGCFIGVLDNIDKDSPCKFHVKGGGWFEYCEPAKKSELKFWGE